MKRTSLVLVGALLLSAFASAQSLKYTGTALSDAKSATITVNGNGPTTVKAGKLLFTDGTNTLETYCADATSFLNNAFHNYTSLTVNTNAASNLAKAGRIIGTYFGTATNKDKQAGLQLAIWSALYDGGASFNANGTNFKVSGVSNTILGYASTYYGAINTALPATTAVTLYSSNQQGAQSQLGVSTVPEPATMTALALGAAAMLRRRRK